MSEIDRGIGRVITERAADRCVTHHTACDCREWQRSEERRQLTADLAAARAVIADNDRLFGEVRDERDAARRDCERLIESLRWAHNQWVRLSGGEQPYRDGWIEDVIASATQQPASDPQPEAGDMGKM